ncbi:MAG: hypothetical protein ACE5HQ_13855 [Gemmatimonadota bacterium]
MSKLASALIAASLLIVATVPVLAQDTGPTFVEVETFTVAPEDGPAFVEAVKKIVEAAKLANLDGEFRWSVYQDGDDYRAVSFHKNMAYFDDPAVWMRQFQGTPGEAVLTEAFGMFSGLDMRMTRSVARFVPEWSYQPGESGVTPGEQEGSVVFQTWVKNGQEEAYDENTKAIMAALKETDFAYPIFGHQVIMGDTDETYFVVLHDGLENFYGENSFANAIEKSGIGEKWGALFQARPGLTRGNDNYTSAYRADLSYRP